jgi:acetyl esterase/lipase
MGFSAGGHLATTVSTGYDDGRPDTIDSIERVSSRPNFSYLIYPAIPENIKSMVTSDTSPMFFINAGDDRTTPLEGSLRIFSALRGANVPAELHFYIKGGHGFGLGVRGGAITSWPERMADWLQTIGII